MLFLCMGHVAFLIAHQTMQKFISYIDNVWGAICVKIHFWQAFRKASLEIYGNHSEIFDMDHRRHILEMLQLWRFMKVADIYVNLTGRHHINCRH